MKIYWFYIVWVYLPSLQGFGWHIGVVVRALYPYTILGLVRVKVMGLMYGIATFICISTSYYILFSRLVNDACWVPFSYIYTYLYIFRWYMSSFIAQQYEDFFGEHRQFQLHCSLFLLMAIFCFQTLALYNSIIYLQDTLRLYIYLLVQIYVYQLVFLLLQICTVNSRFWVDFSYIYQCYITLAGLKGQNRCPIRWVIRLQLVESKRFYRDRDQVVISQYLSLRFTSFICTELLSSRVLQKGMQTYVAHPLEVVGYFGTFLCFHSCFEFHQLFLSSENLALSIFFRYGA